MLMIMLRFVCALLAISSAALGFQQDSERDKDVYAIYSLLLTNLRTSHGAYEGDRYLIAAATGPAHPQEPCVRAPRQREQDFREMLADYQRRRAAPRELKPEFKVDKPYVFLSSEDVAAFVADRLPRPGRTPDQADGRFRGVSDLITLADVYFNRRGTLALTAISTWCGPVCALHQWKTFEKLEAGGWREQEWVTCATIAERRAGKPGLSAAAGEPPVILGH